MSDAADGQSHCGNMQSQQLLHDGSWTQEEGVVAYPMDYRHLVSQLAPSAPPMANVHLYVEPARNLLHRLILPC